MKIKVDSRGFITMPDANSRKKLQEALDRLNQMYRIGTSDNPPLAHSPAEEDR